PFVGLFGTIWGIMTSFQSIAASKNTSLAVVAPGIAEALFATAIGLLAAIPANVVGGSSGGRGRGRRGRRAVMSEINVTPFVDVMLVLLIVFMVSAPLLTVGGPLDLPQSAAQALDQDREPLTI